MDQIELNHLQRRLLKEAQDALGCCDESRIGDPILADDNSCYSPWICQGVGGELYALFSPLAKCEWQEGLKQRTIFQLAHEIVHLLNPDNGNEKGELAVLEEGIAVEFFIVAQKNCCPMEPSNSEYGIILKRARCLIWEHLGGPLEAGRRVRDAFCRLSGSSPKNSVSCSQM